MSAIWKYTLTLAGIQSIDMPKGARIVHVESQFEQPCVWAIVDPNAEKEAREFGILTTGLSFNEAECSYLGSFLLRNGAFVGHLVEPVRRPDSRGNDG